jgi:hypothetical protein
MGTTLSEDYGTFIFELKDFNLHLQKPQMQHSTAGEIKGKVVPVLN